MIKEKPKMLDVPIIPKGTLIKWKGDLVCKALVDCWPGEPCTVDTFEWYVAKPSMGDEIHPAIIEFCAARIYAVNTILRHVEDVR